MSPNKVAELLNQEPRHTHKFVPSDDTSKTSVSVYSRDNSNPTENRQLRSRLSFSKSKTRSIKFQPKADFQLNKIFKKILPSTTSVKQSRIANRILYLTNKRVMVLFLSILIILPMFNVDYWTSKNLAYHKDLQFL